MGRADQLMAVRMGRQRLSKVEDKGLLDQGEVDKKNPVLVRKESLVLVGKGFRFGQPAVDKEQMQIGVDMLPVQGSLH